MLNLTTLVKPDRHTQRQGVDDNEYEHNGLRMDGERILDDLMAWPTN